MEIETGIPMPATTKRGAAKTNWAEIPVGGSTFVAGASKRGVATSTTRFGKLHGMTFVVDSAEKNGAAGVRVWRQS